MPARSLPQGQAVFGLRMKFFGAALRGTLALHLAWHHEWCSVGAAEHGVGGFGFVAGELLGDGVEGEAGAEGISLLVERQSDDAVVGGQLFEGFFHQGILAETSANFVVGDLFPQPVGDVCQVAERRAIVGDLSAGVVVFGFTASDGSDERAKGSAGSDLAGLAAAHLFSVSLAVLIEFPALDHPFGRVVLVFDLVRKAGGHFLIRDQAAGFEDEEDVAEFHDGEFHIRSLSLVRSIRQEAAADGPDFGRQRAVLDGPAGDVHLVDPLVADIAVAEIPEPVPVVMDQVAVKILHRGGSDPDVPVQRLRRRFHRFEANAPPGLAAIPLADKKFAVLAALDCRDFIGPGLAAPLLGAVLNHPAIFGGGFHAFAPFEDVVADRLFDVDIFSRLAGPDGEEGVPMVASSDRDHVESLVVEDLTDVLHGVWPEHALRLDRLAPGFPDGLIRINQRGDADIGNLQEFADVRLSPSVNARHADVNGIIGPNDLPRGLRPRDREDGKNCTGSSGL